MGLWLGNACRFRPLHDLCVVYDLWETAPLEEALMLAQIKAGHITPFHSAVTSEFTHTYIFPVYQQLKEIIKPKTPRQ